MTTLLLMNSFSSLFSYRKAIFESHVGYALRQYLDPLWERLSQGDIRHHLESSGERLIIIIDGRPSLLLRFCVLNSLLMTGFKYRCIVYTDTSSLGGMHDLFSDVSELVEIIDLASFGISLLSRSVYNELLKKVEFWSLVPAKSVLLTQPDALLIQPLPDEFFRYDFIGAPWSPNRVFSVPYPEYAVGEFAECGEAWQNIVMNPDWKLPHVRIGNGGHSIRSIRSMFAIASSENSAVNEPEDLFYARNMHRYSATLPSFLEAKRFSCETSYSLSFGSHASYLYLETGFQAEIYERHIKHLAALYAANCPAS